MSERTDKTADQHEPFLNIQIGGMQVTMKALPPRLVHLSTGVAYSLIGYAAHWIVR